MFYRFSTHVDSISQTVIVLDLESTYYIGLEPCRLGFTRKGDKTYISYGRYVPICNENA